MLKLKKKLSTLKKGGKAQENLGEPSKLEQKYQTRNPLNPRFVLN
jgi:hypothetical protein